MQGFYEALGFDADLVLFGTGLERWDECLCFSFGILRFKMGEVGLATLSGPLHA